jgi:dihydropyrimidinase
LGEKGYGRFVKRDTSSIAKPLKEGEWELPL